MEPFESESRVRQQRHMSSTVVPFDTVDDWHTDLCECDQDPGTCCVAAAWMLETEQPAQACDLCVGCNSVCFLAWVLSFTSLCLGTLSLSGLGGIGLLTHFGACYTCKLRTRLRYKYGLVQRHEDCLVHYCCWGCALAQEAREMRRRTSNPSTHGAPVAFPRMSANRDSQGFALESSVDREGHVYVLNAHTGHPALGQVVDAYTAWRMPPPQMGVPVSSLAMGSIHSVPQGYTRENGPDANSVSLPNAVDGVPLEWATDTTMMPPIQQAFVGRPVETVDEQNADANPPSSSGNQPDRLRARDLYEGSQVIEDLLLNLERTMLTLDREAMIDRFVDTCMAQGIRLTCAQLKEVLFHVRQSQETLSDLVEKLFPYIADPGELETTVLDTLPVMFARRIRERLRINENQQSSEQRSMLQGDSDSPVRESSLDCVEDRRLQ
eukprot:CAMPEP_0114238690 /NCGR_PEP_ID=MMETSP0058-20121206/8054_1 /TAXON_ID=36894 /ORGANISM="Pyramimonas parkeae, CCMP726" /LENGTH=436 /DNA_ID=CAMNT_0001350807 /DNA_START=280 /DNA_END=1590 /DNA_ORIENTATION=+